MAKRKSKSSGLNVFTIVLSIVFGLVLLAMLFKAATSTSTESRSKAVETEIVVDFWEFNGTTKEGWVQTNLTSGSVKNGTLYFGVMSANKPSSVTQNTVDGPFANIILQKLKFSLKVNDPPSKLRPSPTPSGKPFTGEVRYMTAGKTTWEAPQPFNGVIDNQFKTTYEVSLATLPGVDITKIQITFKPLPNSTGITFDWIRLTGQPKPTPTPTPTATPTPTPSPTPTPVSFGNMIKLTGNNCGALTPGNISAKLARISNMNDYSGLTIEGWIKTGFSGSTAYIIAGPALRISETSSLFKIPRYSLSIQNNKLKFIYRGGKYESSVLTEFYGEITSNSNIVGNRWYYVTAIRDGSLIRLYINGIEDVPATNLVISDYLNSINSINLGCRYYFNSEAGGGGGLGGDTDYFTGYIDEVSISKTAKYKNNFPVPKSPLSTDRDTIGLWHFDEKTGSKYAYDSSDNPYNGYESDDFHVGNTEFVPSTVNQ